MMRCLKFNRLEIFKFRAFSYCSFKTSYVFLGSMQIKTSFLFALSLNSSCIFFDFCYFIHKLIFVSVLAKKGSLNISYFTF
ncbi:Hypothetical protein, predicted transmembrane protein [Mesomycoplasma ovipneumoniae 14811]|uniref:Uncharacterized protein n=1 Tax=Mesomycoplasma ovipneumoniae 14811 TaxID=1188239 RepID=A0A014M2C1_9BACT|nr:Hypothetical protein, predicted transmembrane protein [Mesomycoplasma ovipneumoniae 14811]